MPLSLAIIVVVLPLVMFLFLGLAGVKMGRKITGVIGVLAMLVDTILAYGVALTYFFGSGQGQIVDGVRQAVVVANPAWLSFTDTLVVRMGVLVDPIAAMMLVVITTVSLMVHLYSLGYMSDHDGNAEKGFQRYYAFLALFTFSMLGLVVATNIFQIFVFFEMVGLSSYLLIGFYYSLPAANHANKKAFIVTRLADLFFLLGVMILSYYTNTFDFDKLVFGPTMSGSLDTAQSAISTAGGATFMGCSVMAWALTFIFIGGAGKSAMYPLHIWLPDAMEGPTPVSALIHAATMVVAGVFLVARLFPLYVLVQGAMNIILVVGAFTAFYAAAIACTQSDIKRALAFSTISQIAFMMTSLAVSSNNNWVTWRRCSTCSPTLCSRRCSSCAPVPSSMPFTAMRTARCTACTSSCPLPASASSSAVSRLPVFPRSPVSGARTRFSSLPTNVAWVGASGCRWWPV